MMKISRILFFAIISVSILCCSKDDDDNIITSEGRLVWYGSPATDGCGLVLEVGSEWYFASSEKNTFVNFSEEDKDRIEVVARYSIAGEKKTVWGCTTTPIKVVDIRRK